MLIVVALIRKKIKFFFHFILEVKIMIVLKKSISILFYMNTFIFLNAFDFQHSIGSLFHKSVKTLERVLIKRDIDVKPKIYNMIAYKL